MADLAPDSLVLYERDGGALLYCNPLLLSPNMLHGCFVTEPCINWTDNLPDLTIFLFVCLLSGPATDDKHCFLVVSTINLLGPGRALLNIGQIGTG